MKKTMRHGKIYKNVEFYGGSNMSQIDWDRIVADADNEARKKGGCGQKVGLNTCRKEIRGCIQMNNTVKLSRFMRKQNR